ncbi:BTAD domain-containing putative transcriptional regulator [Streptomyces sp. NPDC006617]|uniref:AfsR/SARP family transcriptional regulator n=1 Tax=Streptomyces sp. NPDC006617 TaxID=3155354 RepID=UPI0033A3B05F
MRLELLGTVRAWQHGQRVAVGPPKQQAVLGFLASRVNEAVSIEEIADGVWGSELPRTAGNAVHTYVAGLRRALGLPREQTAGGPALVSTGGGYALLMNPANVDARCFEHRLAEARRLCARGERRAALDLLESALDLWRAEAYTAVPGPFAVVERMRLQELRFTAVEEWATEMLAAGRHAEAAVPLGDLVVKAPLRERLRVLLMMSLQGCGRRAHALAVYRETRELLHAELGIEPCPDLRALHERILADQPLTFGRDARGRLVIGAAGDPEGSGGVDGADGSAEPGASGTESEGAATSADGGAGPGPGGPAEVGRGAGIQGGARGTGAQDGTGCGTGGPGTGAVADAHSSATAPPFAPARASTQIPGPPSVPSVRSARITPRPAQLPPTVRGFIGRAAQRRRLRSLIDEVGAHPAKAPAIAVIDGAPGVGKSALALRIAHETAERFPDGQLFVDLCGSGLRRPRVSAGEALGLVLRSLGVAETRLPATVDGRARLYRTLLSGKRTLLFLDDVHDTESLAPLLSGGPTCVLVTSRWRQLGRLPSPHTERIELKPLTPQESVRLLAYLAGPQRLSGARHESFRLALLCGCLPLPLRIAAGALVEDPALSPARLADDIENGRLEQLTVVGDTAASLRMSFRKSYRAVPPEAARMFRLLGLHQGREITESTAATLAGLTREGASNRLDLLAAGHLLEQTGPGRYRLPDLLRLYAAECAEEEPLHGRTGALSRLLAQGDTEESGAGTDAAATLRRAAPCREPLASDRCGAYEGGRRAARSGGGRST